MATVPGQLIWEMVKKNNCFLVKEFGRGNAGVQFSKEPNNLFNLNSYKYSGLANRKTVTIQPGGKDLSVVLGTTKTKKQNKPAALLHKSVMRKEFPRMAKAVTNQVSDNYYRPDLKKAALARLSAVHRSLKVAKSGPKKKNRQAVRIPASAEAVSASAGAVSASVEAAAVSAGVFFFVYVSTESFPPSGVPWEVFLVGGAPSLTSALTFRGEGRCSSSTVDPSKLSRAEPSSDFLQSSAWASRRATQRAFVEPVNYPFICFLTNPRSLSEETYFVRAPKCVIKARDPRLRQISVAAPGFLLPVPVPGEALATTPIFDGIPIKPEASRASHPSAAEEFRPEIPSSQRGEEGVVDILESEDAFEVFGQDLSTEGPILDPVPPSTETHDEMGIQRKPRSSLLDLIESQPGRAEPPKTTQVKPPSLPPVVPPPTQTLGLHPAELKRKR
ncbi:hypothetical protein SO802_001976 [Lithocarpus litseifolius]|uniref:Ribosomal eL28/Mak16 domain-containing protein n=1 Tax=Lithocarpus litseifolius TaxID=425828 RepID=A0AAW2DWH0_9ROSI